MAPNKKSPYRAAGNRRPAKAFDIAPPKKKPSQAAFPAVGMTLSSYSKPSSEGARSKSTVSSPDQPSRWQRFKSKFSKKRVILFIVAVLLISIGWLGWKFAFNVHRLFGGNVLSVFTSEELKGESTGRVNILLAGNSADDPGHPGAALTDSIMILSIDTKNDTGYMMSIPRDLYVSIPDHGRAKINTAYPTGENDEFNESGYAAGGMGLLQKVIDENFGITSHYYALVNYNALRDAVNSVGGVDVTINSSDPRGLYDPSRDWTVKRGVLVKLSNGKHTLNGQQALNLARARGDARGSYGFANSDFTRAENQRLLILALRSKATSAGVLTNPIKLGNLFDSVGSNVKTDMNLGNVKRLYEITKKVSSNNIRSVGLNDADGVNLLKNYRTPRGESALIPEAGLDDFSDIQRYIQRLTSSNLVVRENADVVVLNGTTRSGLAARESDLLANRNIRVGAKADADNENYAATQIIDLSGGKMPATRAALQKYFTGSTVTSTNPFGDQYEGDFIVILGADRIPAESSGQ